MAFQYEVVLRITHNEPPNPDMPSLNINWLALYLAHEASFLADVSVEVVSAELKGTV
jgi:hypothetical protein